MSTATSTDPQTATPTRIVVSDLSKRFGSVHAVDGLSFVVEPGQVTGFLGPNGAGKTTTLRMALGLITPDLGSATYAGTPYSSLAHPSSQVGAVLETAFHLVAADEATYAFIARPRGCPMNVPMRSWPRSG